ncbi:hypothetical protein BUALT_Bualt07G0026700 [Buddleja alternifolia]|uniref:Uncharacterized protein n=2 Tax=Buddleja alternifolia TaxID=168488 RepID=A0AAV6XEC4_9LAMI|nr:hypothetical protein BUALT_Bualt07G0026700 [Buddleja alternifolia]
MPWNVPDNNTDVEKQLEAPMPWIGMYVAAASLLCTLAMAADVFNGFRSKKYWFPSKYFSLNATSLTLLAVAMKLPVDLTTRMYTATDRLAKVSSLVFMSTAMSNFLTSLGSMGDKDILMNVTALGILVITVTTNVCIQVIQLHSFLGGRLVFAEEVLAVCSMLLLLVMFSSSALMIPSTKRYLETKYKEMHKSALIEEQVEMGRITTDKLRVLIKKYWVMAETSSPQFVIARSVMSTSSGVMTLLISLVFLEAQIRMAMEFKILDQSNSSYGWSTKWILLTQTIGVVVATIAPASRWFVAISFRSSNDVSSKSIKSAFTVEGYWTQKMVEWKQGSLSFKIRHLKRRKVVHDLRGSIIKLCIFAQFLIVLASKLVLLVSVCITSPPVSCFNFVKKLKTQKQISNSDTSRHREVTNNTEVDIEHYVMLLEGEVELPKQTLGNICKEVDYIIQKGKMHKPKNLLNFLYKSRNFDGVTEFDSHQVQSLHSQYLPYCWSLPVVTLTSIALAIPHIEKHKSNNLLNCVTEGLPFVELVDKNFDRKGSLSNMRTAADVVWVGVELYHKWQDNDLHETSLKGKNSTEILQELSNKAEKTVLEFKSDARDCLMRNPLNWPAKVIAANSMHRISRTMLLTHGIESDKTDEELFEQLSVMIADIIAACLTNLARVMTMKCHSNAIEEREKSVREAALLLGETEEILGLLQQRELPVLLDCDQAAYIEEWRAFIKKENKINQEPMSRHNAEIDASKSKKEHVTIEVEG